MIQASPDAVRQMQVLGINPLDLEDMVSRSAICTHPKGNRRFHNWIFLVENEMVHSVWDSREDAGPSFLAWEIHDVCSGEGCAGCGFVGEVKIRRFLKKS